MQQSLIVLALIGLTAGLPVINGDDVNKGVVARGETPFEKASATTITTGYDKTEKRGEESPFDKASAAIITTGYDKTEKRGEESPFDKASAAIITTGYDKTEKRGEESPFDE